MTLTFNEDPCLDSESSFRDDNVFKRSVIRLLCRLVPSATTLLGKIGLIDSAGVDIDVSNPLPIQGSVTISTLPPVTVVLPADASTSTLQIVGNNTLTAIAAGVASQTATQATAANQAAANALLSTIDTSLNSIETAADTDYSFAFAEDATYTWLGWAAPGTAEGVAAWKIARITNASNRKLWADGNKNFDNVWTAHAGLVYS